LYILIIFLNFFFVSRGRESLMINLAVLTWIKKKEGKEKEKKKYRKTLKKPKEGVTVSRTQR